MRRLTGKMEGSNRGNLGREEVCLIYLVMYIKSQMVDHLWSFELNQNMYMYIY